MNKTVTDIMDLWEGLITDDMNKEEKLWLVDQSCNVSSRIISLQLGGYSYQEAVDTVYEREYNKYKYYQKGISYKYPPFDDSIMYMYPERLKVIGLDSLPEIPGLPIFKV